MRRKVIAGNWKMNKDLSEGIELVSKLKSLLSDNEVDSKVIICPPSPLLETMNAIIKGTNISLGAQNMHFENSGAFTGENSAGMLLSVGCEFVILGHSERRTIFFESDEMINKKLHSALDSGLNPIFCVGESLDDRENGTTENVIKSQLENGLAGIDKYGISKIIIAYEPIWAIGTGKTASPEQAQEVHFFIRNFIKNHFGVEEAENIVIQYGGSVKPNNANELLSQNDIDGALVGGACLDANSFFDIIKST